MHERLAQSLALTRIASRLARLGGWTIDLPDYKLTWSDENCAIHDVPPGYQPSLEEGLGLFEPEHREHVMRLVEACVRDGTPYEFELPKFTVTGRRIWVRSIGEAVRDASGTIVRLQGAFQDISERVALEEQLRQAQRLESLGQLTGGVAHDFNNLLTVILGNAEMLGEELEGKPALQPLAHVITEAAQRGAHLTQRLLAFARRQALEPRVVDVNRLVGEIEALLRRTLGQHIVIAIEPGDAVWPALVDPMQLDDALLNLCLNARDAMPHGGQLTIRTVNVRPADDAGRRHPALSDGEYVMLAVVDTGTGIAPEHLARVFEPFFTTKEKGKGTGLGLAMAYGFVKQSGGHVEIESQPGRGTTVRLYLPRASGVADAPAATPTPQPQVRRTGARRTILLVEDDALVRRYAHDQLLAIGHAVLEAGSGPEALALLERHEGIDLLFTDVAMPDMSGRDLADLAREKRPGLRVLYMSGYAQEAIVHDGRLDAGVQLLVKPYRREELARQVAMALAR
jgi:signal transduction histidine kinase